MDGLAKQWDVIVVGTGMGGSTVGYALAKAGKSVLFCEKGSATPMHFGTYAETWFTQPSVPEARHAEILAQSGRYYETIRDISNKRPRDFIPFIGCGVGGSSAIYGMVLERFAPGDFTPRRHHPEATDSSLPEAWPISYEELEPYYAQAEALFRVKGGSSLKDVSLPPQPRAMHPASQEFFSHLEGQGLHPYRLPLASDFLPDCKLCQGFLCGRKCKNDSRRICLDPALQTYGAVLLDECAVERLEATHDSVTALHCTHRGQPLTLRGTTIILACGAIETPRLLLKSATKDWPNGLANRSGLVGKNLMRHHIDLLAITPKHREAASLPNKDIGLNDFYDTVPKLGSIQSFGNFPPVEMMLASFYDDLRYSPLKPLLPLLRLMKPILKIAMTGLRKRSIVLAAILEDLPYEDNCVMLPPEGEPGIRLQLRYRIHEYEKRRMETFRQRIKTIFKPYPLTLIKQAANNQLIAHGCGTCRFGNDPATSVLDRNNKAHGITNLYVVGASFFPSSGAINPGLTIAANALRVAEHLTKVEPVCQKRESPQKASLLAVE